MTSPDPYQPPQSSVGEPDTTSIDARVAASTRVVIDRLLFILGLAGLVLTALMASLMVPQFDELYRNFGAELPLPTALVTNYHGIFWALPLLPIALRFGWLGWPSAARRSRLSAIVAIALPVLCFPLLIFALYLPSFRLAATI